MGKSVFRDMLGSIGYKALLAFVAILGAVTVPPPHLFAEDPSALLPRNAHHYWTYLGGYGVSHPGFGDTDVRVETVDAVLRYGRFLSEDIGASWYRGRHTILVELPLRMVVDPDVAPMVGVNFLACWTFTASEKVVPYIFAGGGPLYTSADIPGVGSELNGNYQSGYGIHYRTAKGTYLNFEYRLHHISNASTKEPNMPINSSRFLVGVTFFR